MKQIPFLLQCSETMLFCEGILWNASVLFGWGWAGWWVVAARRRRCVSACYEANVPNGKSKKAGGRWNILAITSIVSLPFPISVKITSHPADSLAQPVFMARVQLQCVCRWQSTGLLPKAWGQSGRQHTGWRSDSTRRSQEERRVCVYVCVRVW